MLIKIYIISNKINKKIYIGITTRPIKERWQEHCRHKNKTVISKAISKYGKENFTINLLTKTTSLKRALDLESNYIKQYKTLSPYGYNIAPYGNGNGSGKALEKEFRKFMSQKSKKIMKALKNNPEWKEKQKRGVKKAWENNTNRINKAKKTTKKTWEKADKRKKTLSERMKNLWTLPENKEYRQKQIKILTQNNTKLKKAVLINGIIYKSMTAAAKSLKISIAEISASIKRKRKGYTLA